MMKRKSKVEQLYEELTLAQRELVASVMDGQLRSLGLATRRKAKKELVPYVIRVTFRALIHVTRTTTRERSKARPPFNAEYVLYLLLRRDERDAVIGDLIEDYGKVLDRFNKRRADIWFYKEVFGSVLPLLRRTVLRLGALVWLGRMLRRLIS